MEPLGTPTIAPAAAAPGPRYWIGDRSLSRDRSFIDRHVK
jgi:hypothetical protein